MFGSDLEKFLRSGFEEIIYFGVVDYLLMLFRYIDCFLVILLVLRIEVMVVVFVLDVEFLLEVI